MKNNLLFIYSTNILVRLPTVNMKNFLTPKNPKMCDPTLVTVWKMQRHYSQSSRENATPSSGTSLFASYKEVLPPPPSSSESSTSFLYLIVVKLSAFCGCLPFTKCFWKIRLESKWNTPFWGLSSGNFQGATEHQKESYCFSGWNVPNGNSCPITSRPYQFQAFAAYFVEWNWFLQMVNAIWDETYQS